MERTICWRLSGLPREEIEEVVSSLWARLIEADCARLKSFGSRNGARLTTWLVAVAKNAASDYLRRKRPAAVSLDLPAQEETVKPRLADVLSDGSPGHLEGLIAREDRREILLSVKGLPWIYRQTIYARFYKRLSANATAAALKIDEDTVYVRVARAFAKLRKELARRGFDYKCIPAPRSRRQDHAHLHFSGKTVARLMETLGRKAAWKLCRADMGEFCPLCRKTFLSVALMWRAFTSRRAKPA